MSQVLGQCFGTNESRLWTLPIERRHFPKIGHSPNRAHTVTIAHSPNWTHVELYNNRLCFTLKAQDRWIKPRFEKCKSMENRIIINLFRTESTGQ